MENYKERMQETVMVVSNRLKHVHTDGNDLVYCLDKARQEKENLKELTRTIYSSGRPLLATAIRMNTLQSNFEYYIEYLDDRVSDMKRALIDVEESTNYAYDLLTKH